MGKTPLGTKHLVHRLRQIYEDGGEPVFLEPENAQKQIYYYPGKDGLVTSEIVDWKGPTMTNREVLLRYFGATETELEQSTDEDLEFNYGVRLAELDEEADTMKYVGAWTTMDSPWAMAVDYLSELDLGLDDERGDCIGLELSDSSQDGTMGEYREYHLGGDIDASLLQARLIELGEPVRVVKVEAE